MAASEISSLSELGYQPKSTGRFIEGRAVEISFRADSLTPVSKKSRIINLLNELGYEDFYTDADIDQFLQLYEFENYQDYSMEEDHVLEYVSAMTGEFDATESFAVYKLNERQKRLQTGVLRLSYRDI